MVVSSDLQMFWLSILRFVHFRCLVGFTVVLVGLGLLILDIPIYICIVYDLIFPRDLCPSFNFDFYLLCYFYF